MEFEGSRQITTYMSGPHAGGAFISSFLPAVGTMQGTWKAYDTYPAPAPLRRSLTTIPWSPSIYYSSAKVNHTLPSEKKLPEPLAYENHMSQLDSLKVPPIFSAARNALYTRYTPDDWQRHKKSISADMVRSTGERLRLEANRLAAELDDKAKATTASVDKKLGARVSDINFWKTELNRETGEMIDENDKLNGAKRALETFLKEVENQLHIAQECLYNREKRQGIDLVHDGAEKDLIGEVDLVRQCEQTARALINRTNAQLNLNRAAQHELEKDVRNKHLAGIIDSGAHYLKDTSRGLQLHRGVERIDNTISVPESWAEFTDGNIKRSQAERTNSKHMRSDIHNVLYQVNDQLWKQWNKVNTSLTNRIRETMDARSKIERHLSGTLQETFDTEKHIEFLKKAINDKINPLKVATTRLENRLHRPHMEACRDAAQNRLVQEVHELDETIESLTNQLRRTENQLQQLLRKRAQLERDLSVKNNTLYIDSEKCMGMRKTYPIQDRVWKL